MVKLYVNIGMSHTEGRSVIHFTVCLSAYPQPLPKQVLKEYNHYIMKLRYDATSGYVERPSNLFHINISVLKTFDPISNKLSKKQSKWKELFVLTQLYFDVVTDNNYIFRPLAIFRLILG
jgi:hypothetical protein